MTVETDERMEVPLPLPVNLNGNNMPLNDVLPWVEKYRPADLNQIISHKEIIDTIKKLIDSNRMPHLLLYGPAGVGKTTAVLAIARLLNGPGYRNMVLELNASDDRGIDVVREQIKDFASSRQLFAKGLKLIILDECDSMTSAAQFALRRIIEKYTKNVRFCLICNYVNKIIPALQSRCTKFRFGPLQMEQIENRLKQIATAENCNITNDGMQAIIKLSGGDMRRCLNVLQSCHMAYDIIVERNVHLCTGTPLSEDIETIQHILFNNDVQSAYSSISALQVEKGLAIADIVQHLHELLLRTDLNPSSKAYLLDQLSNVEYRMLSGCNEKIQLAGLIGIYQITKAKALRETEANENNAARAS